MPKAKINTFKSQAEPGATEMHYGYLCTVLEGGVLVAEIPEEMIEGEVAAGRAEIIVTKAPAPKTLEEMKAGELVAYASENNLDIGGLVAQAGKEKILAAVLEAIAKMG